MKVIIIPEIQGFPWDVWTRPKQELIVAHLSVFRESVGTLLLRESSAMIWYRSCLRVDLECLPWKCTLAKERKKNKSEFHLGGGGVP